MAHDGRLARDDEGWPHKPFRCALRGREKHFLPELPPLEPFGESSELTNAEVEYARPALAVPQLALWATVFRRYQG
jgi:hypothetical protein